MKTLWLAGAAWLLAAPVQAQSGTPGVITGVMVTPKTMMMNQTATISIGGSGALSCGVILVDWGDGTPKAELVGKNFPVGAQHTYVKGGTFTISATPGNGCNAAGPKTATIMVQGAPANPREVPCPGTVIHSVMHTAPLEPTEQLIVQGCGFGDGSSAPHRLLLKGSFRPGGIPVQLEIMNWSDKSIVAKVPAMSGVRDQPAKLQVVLEPRPNSNEFTLEFRATREIRPITEPGVVKLTCAPAAAKGCTTLHTDFDILHGTAEKETAQGQDVIMVSLKNGWVVESFHGPSLGCGLLWNAAEFGINPLNPGKSVMNGVGQLVGSSSGALTVNWSLSGGQYVSECGWFLVRGPVGVSMKSMY